MAERDSPRAPEDRPLRAADVRWSSSIDKPATELTYPTTPNAGRYNRLMYYLHEQHRRESRFSVPETEIFAFMQKAYPGSYSEEECRADLAMLVGWGVLTLEDRRSQVTRLDELVARHKAYRMTPAGIRVEELRQELASGVGPSTSLSPSRIETLLQNLKELGDLLAEPWPEEPALAELQRVEDRWGQAYDDFRRVSSDAQNYISRLDQATTSLFEDPERFLAYKTSLRDYLTTFVEKLSVYSADIGAVVTAWSRDGRQERLLGLLTAYRLQTDPEVTAEVAVREELARRFNGLLQKFGPGREIERLEASTRDVIGTIVRYNLRLADQARGGVDVKRQLARLAHAFAVCPDEEARARLAGIAFGVTNPRHLTGDRQIFAMDRSGSVWSQQPTEIQIRPIRAGRRRGRREPPPVRDRRAEQARIRAEERVRIERARALWNRIFAEGPVNLGAFEAASPEIRNLLLEVVGHCLASVDRTTLAEDGTRIELLGVDGRRVPAYGTLGADDGVLLTPGYVLRRVRRPAHRRSA